MIDNSSTKSTKEREKEHTREYPQASDKSHMKQKFCVRVLSDPKFLLFRVLPCLSLLGFFIIVFIIIFILSGVLAIKQFAPGINVIVQDSGAVEINLPKGRKTSWFLLSPTGNGNTPWVDTKIKIPRDATIRIRSSGRSTMAIHHIVKAANEYPDYPPLHPWVGPAGLDLDRSIPKRTKREEDEKRLDYLILPGKPQGELLGIISDSDPKVRPVVEEIYEISDGCTINNKDHDGGTLWLAVNEIWLDDKTLDSLKIKDSNNALLYNELKNQEYASAWYDDNAGAFLVVVEVELNKFFAISQF